ncbi:epoxide hydrolase family protein [Arthrobacter sp. UYCu723]
MTNNEIHPYAIKFSQAELDELHRRLTRTRWIDELPDTGWERGVPTGYLRDLTTYWAEKFDWSAVAARLNQYPQFTTTIDDQNIHFLHIRSQRPDATALLLIHGWPGTVADFLELIEPLTNPDDADIPAFHLVIPSLPGHGFSGPITTRGWNDGVIAGAFAQLMARLGYDRYGVQGGDHGAFIASRLGREDAEHVIGVHTNALVTFPTGDPADMAALTDGEKARLGAMKEFQENGSAYMQVAGTRPNTIAQLLADSPTGQLAWIVEKYHEWAEQALTPDQILTTATIYWLTDTARSVANFYYERFNDPSMWAPKPKGTVPTGVAVFAKADFAIRRFAEKTHNITHWSEFFSGGHFPALEVPELLTGDIREFYGALSH